MPNRKPQVMLPEGTPEFMAPAYFGCLQWAIGFEDMRKQFETETGTSAPALPRSPIEAMVDKACGIDRQQEAKDYFNKFKAWHDVNVWGDINAPDEIEVRETKKGK